MYNPFSAGQWRPVLRRQPSGVTEVALTFDDGPSPATTPAVLKALARARATATFFLSGVRVNEHQGLAADIVAAGHAVYGHGWEHEDLEELGPDRALAAMLRAEEALVRLRPTPSPYLVRLPYNAGYNRSWMHRVAARFHPDARFAWWTLSTRDFSIAEGCATRDAVEARCQAVAAHLGRSRHLPGAIVLMHENPFGGSGELSPIVAGALLPRVLEAISARGLSPGPVRPDGRQRRIDRYVFLNGGGDLDRPPAPVRRAA